MVKKNTIISINGKHYDAITGAPLHADAKTSSPKPTAAKSIDGVVGGTRSTSHARAATKPAASRKQTARRQAATHAKAHQAKPSTILMRHAVTKPTATSLKKKTKVQGSTLATVSNYQSAAIVQKHSIYGLNQQRAHRASKIGLSPKISRFANENVGQAIAEVEAAMVIPQTVTPTTVVYRPDVQQLRVRPSTSSDIFEQALQRATSHDQPAPELATSKKGRRAASRLRKRMVSYSAGAVAVLAIIGVFGFQQVDTVKFRIATNDAGFSATMPEYNPEGYKVADISAYNGYVGITYTMPTPSGLRKFAVTERPTNWDSQKLRDSIVAQGLSTPYFTVEKDGRTVYFYGRNQAAWVNNGILYQSIGSGTPPSQEMSQLAASM